MDDGERRRLVLCFLAENALPLSLVEDRLFREIAGPEYRHVLKSRQTMVRHLTDMHEHGEQQLLMQIKVRVY